MKTLKAGVRWLAGLVLVLPLLVHGQSAIGTNASNLSTEINQLREQLDVQTKRIDRLYRAIGPRLDDLEAEAAELEKQQQEDNTLALEPICEIKDESLSSVGAVSPVAAEFGVLTEDGGIRIFDAAGKVLKALQQRKQEITCLTYSPNGKELLAGTAGGSLIIWNLADDSSEVICTNIGKKVDRVAWLGNDRVVWGSNQRYWDSGSKPIDHDKRAGAVLSRNGTRQLWQFRGFIRDDFYTLAGAQNGSMLAILEIPDQPRGAFLLDGATGNVLHTCYDKQHGSGPLSVGISPDASTLAVGYAPYDVILWNARTGERLKLLKGHSNWVVSLAFSSDGNRLISGAGDSTARIWDFGSGKEIGRLRFPGPSTYVEGVGFSPKGDVVFALARGILKISNAPR